MMIYWTKLAPPRWCVGFNRISSSVREDIHVINSNRIVGSKREIHSRRKRASIYLYCYVFSLHIQMYFKTTLVYFRDDKILWRREDENMLTLDTSPAGCLTTKVWSTTTTPCAWNTVAFVETLMHFPTILRRSFYSSSLIWYQCFCPIKLFSRKYCGIDCWKNFQYDARMAEEVMTYMHQGAYVPL